MLSIPEQGVAPGVSVPVTLVCGLPSAGKSAMIDYLLRASAGRRIAVIPTSGCSQVEIAGQVLELAAKGRHDYLLMELAAGHDPAAFVSSLNGSQGADASSRGPQVDTVVAVVDAETLLSDFCSQDLLSDRLPTDAGDLRSVADALTEQIELADVVVLNRARRVSSHAREGLVALVAALNPESRLIESELGEVHVADVIGTQRFTLRGSHARSGWIRAMAGERIPGADRHGIVSLVYRERRPFHPQRLRQFFSDEWPGVVRSRGVFWLATRMDSVGELSQAGAARRFRSITSWWAKTLEGRTFEPREVERFLGVPWDAQFGDRRQELAFVGIRMDEEALRARLDACLLSVDEMRGGPEVWQTFSDPFPPWGSMASRRRATLYN